MKLKKAMAVLLAVSTIMSSQAFTTSVFGSVGAEGEIMAETVEEPAGELNEESSDSPEEPQDKTDVSDEESADENNTQNESSADESLNTKDTTEEDVLEETPEETPEVTDDSESEITEETDVNETLDSEAEAEEDTEELPEIEEKTESVDDDGNVIESADDYFVRTNTTLTLKPGAVLAPVVTVPREVTTIPANIFKNNSIVKKVKFEAGSSLEKIDADAFRNSGLEEIVIPKNKDNKPITIGSAAFKGSKLKSIVFNNDTLATVEEYTFASTNIASISLGQCTEIKENAFANCVYLENISFPKLEIIRASAFEGCSSLNDWMSIPDTVKVIESNAFKSCGFTTVNLSKLPLLECKGQSTYPDKYDDNSTLGLAVFANNTRLTTVSLANAGNDKFSFLPARTFEGCTALKYVTVHDKLKVIGDNAFENCSSLKEIDLVNAQYINSEAFKGCSALSTVTMKYKDLDENGNEKSHIAIMRNSFPNKSGVTLKAYDSFVREYANDMPGYSFQSLYTNHIYVYAPSTMIPTLSSTNPEPGDEVIITVPTSNTDFLTQIYYTYEGGSQIEPKYLGDDGEMLTFSFIMPDKSVSLTLRSATAANLKASSYTFGFIGGTVPKKASERSFSWEKTGCSTTLVMNCGLTTQATNWLYTFKSENEDILTVTPEGVVSGISTDTSKITITPKYNTGASTAITIVVGGSVRIGQVYTGQGYTGVGDAKYSPKDLITVGPAGEITIDPETGYPVVTFNKNMVAKAKQTISVNIKAYQYKQQSDPSLGFANAKNDDSSTVKSFWSSTDTSIATVSKKTATDNKNVITVKKGSSGESLISVYTLNKDEKTPNQFDSAYADNIGHIIVRVVDITPRLVDTSLDVNHQLIDGTPITVVPVYGFDILDDEGLYIAKKKVVKGITEYYTDKDTAKFEIVDGNDGHWYVKTTESVTVPMNKTEKYKKNTLYLCGYYKDTNKGAFQIPLPEVTISNTVPKPKITQSGSINLFYNGKASEDELGKVTITQSLSNLVVDKYELVSAQNYKLKDSETNNGIDTMRDPNNAESLVPYDSLGYNFNIYTDKDSTNNSRAIIKRSKVNDDLAVISKKTVVSGYLYIYFAGYKTPSKIAITVNNKNTAPTYLLNMTSATAHVNETNQEYKLWLYKKGASSAEADRLDLAPTYENGGEMDKNVVFDVEKTKGNFLLAGLQSGLSDDYLMLKVKSGDHAKAGRSVIKLHMTTWSNPNYYMSFNFDVKTTDKIGVKLSATSKTLNRAWVRVGSLGDGDKQEINVTSTINDAYISKVCDFVGKKDNAAYNTLKSLLAYEPAGPDDIAKNPAKIIINQPTGATLEEAEAIASGIPNGKYYFTAVPYAKFYKNTSESGIKLSPVKFTIVVVNNAPKITVGAMTFNTNSVVTNESPTASAKLENIISGTVQGDYKLVADEAEYVKRGTTEKKDTGYFSGHIVNLNYDDDRFTNPVKGTKQDSFSAAKWTVSKMKVVSPNGCVATASPYTLEFKGISTKPTITVKASGSLNMIRPLDTIKYTSTLNNVKGNINGVGVREIAPNGSYMKSRFKVKSVGSTVFLSFDPEYEGEKPVPGTTYRVALCYSVDSMSNNAGQNAGQNAVINEDNADIITYVNVKPIESFPKVTVTTSKSYAYAGQDKKNTNWYVTVTAQVESAFRGYYDANGNGKFDAGNDTPYINVAGVDWASTMSKANKNEFEIIKDGKGNVIYSYDPVTGKIVFRYKLKNASEQLQNKKYKISFTTLFNEIQVKEPVKGKNYDTEITVRK